MPADATPVDAVIARMEAIAAGLDPADGVAAFNGLYLAVTRGVAAQMRSATYADPAFLATLDVGFAALYFAAVDRDAAGERPATPWRPLFEARRRAGVAPIQFAIAGMNAHINHDLALALNTACDDRGVDLGRHTPQHADYERVNVLLARVQDEVKARYATGLVGWADDALGRLDDILATWSIARARDAAWTHAEALSALRHQEWLRDELLDTLASSVGLISRALLVPTA